MGCGRQKHFVRIDIRKQNNTKNDEDTWKKKVKGEKKERRGEEGEKERRREEEQVYSGIGSTVLRSICTNGWVNLHNYLIILLSVYA